MRDYTEDELECIENSIVEAVDDNLRGMSLNNKRDLLDMLIDTLINTKEDLERVWMQL